MKFGTLKVRAAAMLLISGICIVSLSPKHASASAAAVGCTAFSVSVSDSGPNIGESLWGQFVAGDVVTMTVTGNAVGSLYAPHLHGYVLSALPAGTYTYIVTAETAGSFDPTYNHSYPPQYTVSWSCSHPSGSNLQQNGAQIQGQNSNFAINGILDGIISGSAGDSFQPFSANQNGAAVMVAPDLQITPTADVPNAYESESPWRMWMVGRYTRASGSETGSQFNGVFGTSYRFGNNSTLGLFGGYEVFDYTDAAPAQLDGNGLSVGGYVAGTFADRLKLDARAYTTLMNYNIDLAGTTGEYAAQRLGTSLTASYELGSGATSFTPFVRGTGLFEWQDAYTDSLAATHPEQYLAQGIISPGMRISHVVQIPNGSTFTPYLAGEGDFTFGNTTLAGFSGSTGFSGKVSAGAQWQLDHGLSLGLDGSYGGIGSTIQSQSIQGTLTIPF